MHTLGKGTFAWTRQERISDKYSKFFLNNTPEYNKKQLKQLEDKNGVLYARVIEGNESSHIGDIIRGLVQEDVPNQGQEFKLGRGSLIVDWDSNKNIEIGIQPKNDSSSDWLNPESMYQIHDCIVEVYFKEQDNL